MGRPVGSVGVLLGLVGAACASATTENPRAPATAEIAASVDTRGYELPARPAGTSFPEEPLAPIATDAWLTRLSHTQYRHTIADLFGIREDLDLPLSPDALDGFGFDTSNAFRVDLRLGPQYRAAAEALAERAVNDPAIFARVVPCSPQAPACRDEFLRAFGARAFRRPPSEADIASFRPLFGAAEPPAEDAFRLGVRRSVEAMLQSPEFLYVVVGAAAPLGSPPAEASPSASGERLAARQLDDYEVAARLSYFLYDSMPDEALFTAAREQRLHTPEQIEAAARYMLTQPRVLEKLVAFHEQLWQFERFARISPDAATYPMVPDGFVQSVRHATRSFVRDILRTGGGLTELLTAPYAYADDGLRVLYGAPKTGSARFARVDFDPATRRGLLMQVGYLASNAYSIRTDPIHRGLFVIRNLLCRTVPDPPPGATTTPPPETERPIVTTRDEVDLVTGQSFCPTCHTEINAPGFAFEGFDAVGQARAFENGAPVDTSASLWIDGRLARFDGAVELVELLARSREAHRCYSRRWMEFAYGRPLATSDLPTLDRLAASSMPIADIILAIVRSPAFWSLPARSVESKRASVTPEVLQ
jgi:hypothetical protein